MHHYNPHTRRSDTVIIKPLKPLLYDFFVSNRPKDAQKILEDEDLHLQLDLSQRLENNKSFKPKLNCKRMMEQPKFFLSVERKKIKVINGLGHKAHLQEPTRTGYRGSVVKSLTNDNHETQIIDLTDRSLKYRRVQSQQLPPRPLAKSKTPHLPFNLKHLLQTCKALPQQFSREQHITGTSFPYYNHYSSKEPMSSRKNSRQSRQGKRNMERERYFSTMDIKN